MLMILGSKQYKKVAMGWIVSKLCTEYSDTISFVAFYDVFGIWLKFEIWLKFGQSRFWPNLEKGWASEPNFGLPLILPS